MLGFRNRRLIELALNFCVGKNVGWQQYNSYNHNLINRLYIIFEFTLGKTIKICLTFLRHGKEPPAELY